MDIHTLLITLSLSFIVLGAGLTLVFGTLTLLSKKEATTNNTRLLQEIRLYVVSCTSILIGISIKMFI